VPVARPPADRGTLRIITNLSLFPFSKSPCGGFRGCVLLYARINHAGFLANKPNVYVKYFAESIACFLFQIIIVISLINIYYPMIDLKYPVGYLS